MVGSAIHRSLLTQGHDAVIGRSSRELDLRNQDHVISFF
jgi:GDP-L-fucose synthase